MSLRILSISQLSEVTGKDRRTVKDRLAGLTPHSEDKRARYYDAPAAIELILSIDTIKGIDKKLQIESLGLEKARREKLEIEVSKLRGDLVSIEDVAKVVEKEYSIIRSQIRAIPSKLAKPLSIETDPNVVHTRLTEAVDECLTELTADNNYEQQRLNLERITDAFAEKSEVNVSSVTTSELSGVGGQV